MCDPVKKFFRQTNKWKILIRKLLKVASALGVKLPDMGSRRRLTWVPGVTWATRNSPGAPWCLPGAPRSSPGAARNRLRAGCPGVAWSCSESPGSALSCLGLPGVRLGSQR
jgi:hypothetical protein